MGWFVQFFFNLFWDFYKVKSLFQKSKNWTNFATIGLKMYSSLSMF